MQLECECPVTLAFQSTLPPDASDARTEGGHHSPPAESISDPGTKSLTAVLVGVVALEVGVVVLVLDSGPLDALQAGSPQQLDLVADRALDFGCAAGR
jgi:hypothetical protein